MINSNLIIITPVYEDAQVATKLFKDIGEIYNNAYIVAVDDGSINHTLHSRYIEAAGLQGVVITLKKNVGHQRSIAIGLSYVSDNINNSCNIIIMDSDGEDTPTSIQALLKLLKSDNVDVVVAERKSRIETLWFRFFYIVYKRMFRLLSGRKISFGNFMAIKSSSIKRLVAMQELWLHIASCVLMSKLRIKEVALDRGKRYAGKGKMNFIGQVLHGFRALMVFSEDVLVRVGMACASVAALAILGGIAAVTLKIFGFATPGWFSVALGILLLVFLQTGALTLITLMLTGIVKSGTIVSIKYQDFIDTIHHTNSDHNG